jgi:hypothetical protein
MLRFMRLGDEDAITYAYQGIRGFVCTRVVTLKFLDGFSRNLLWEFYYLRQIQDRTGTVYFLQPKKNLMDAREVKRRSCHYTQTSAHA